MALDNPKNATRHSFTHVCHKIDVIFFRKASLKQKQKIHYILLILFFVSNKSSQTI